MLRWLFTKEANNDVIHWFPRHKDIGIFLTSKFSIFPLPIFCVIRSTAANVSGVHRRIGPLEERGARNYFGPSSGDHANVNFSGVSLIARRVGGRGIITSTFSTCGTCNRNLMRRRNDSRWVRQNIFDEPWLPYRSLLQSCKNESLLYSMTSTLKLVPPR